MASGNKAKKVMMTLASDPILCPSASFNLGMRKNRGIHHLDFAFSILPKFGYWATLFPDDCIATDSFANDAGNTYIVVSTIHLYFGCWF